MKALREGETMIFSPTREVVRVISQENGRDRTKISNEQKEWTVNTDLLEDIKLDNPTGLKAVKFLKHYGDMNEHYKRLTQWVKECFDECLQPYYTEEGVQKACYRRSIHDHERCYYCNKANRLLMRRKVIKERIMAAKGNLTKVYKELLGI